jgi:hypothetical protein
VFVRQPWHRGAKGRVCASGVYSRPLHHGFHVKESTNWLRNTRNRNRARLNLSDFVPHGGLFRTVPCTEYSEKSRGDKYTDAVCRPRASVTCQRWAPVALAFDAERVLEPSLGTGTVLCPPGLWGAGKGQGGSLLFVYTLFLFVCMFSLRKKKKKKSPPHKGRSLFVPRGGRCQTAL